MVAKINIFGIICGIFYFCCIVNGAYYGTKIGSLAQLHHGVSGDVYAVDSRTLFLKNFNYDGEGPAAYFYVGNSHRPSNNGALRLRDERGSSGVIKKYRNKDITLSLPEGKTLRDIKWFSVWCDDFSVNFGDVTIGKNLDFPRPQKITALGVGSVHGVSSENIVVVDAQTLLVPNFSYDGDAPDAKFWVGRGPKPSPQGIRIPDENGKENPLRRYDKKTIVLTLPGDLTVFDIGHFGVWCEAFTVDFGHVKIPDSVNVPPSLKMLGISPQSKLNCEVLYDDLAYEVRWAVAGESIVVQLVSKLENREYMSFGISPDKQHTVMVGADVAVAWVDKETGKGYAHDYYLDAKSQCSGKRGSCPDTVLQESGNSIRLLNAAMVNGYSIVTFQRPLKASDEYDLTIYVNESQAIVWAIGPLNQRSEVSYHSKFTKGDRLIDFGRQPFWNCPLPDGEKNIEEQSQPEYYNKQSEEIVISNNKKESNAYLPTTITTSTTTERPQRRVSIPTPKPVLLNDGAWDIPAIQCYEPEDGVFYAQMGPTGGKQGYPAITGHVGWGISWYINGLLIPEINMVRGKTYTFVVEGGNNPDVPAKYHPFYITDDPVGGFEHKTDAEKSSVRVFAGLHKSRSGVVTPTGVGRICNWTPDPDGPTADEYPSFGAYQRSLTLKCDEGEPGIITWTPDHNTPDTLYYQCYTHRYLGWKINVLDSCDEAQASDVDKVYAEPEFDVLEGESSIRHETKIKPNDIFLSKHEKDLIKNHNMNSAPPKIQIDLQKNNEITRLIADGIRAAEALEESIAYKNKNVTLYEEHLNENKNYPNLQQQEINIPFDRPGLPVFLRPPQNGPIFRPVKLPMRRPINFSDRRPIQRQQPSYRPIIFPQPSIIVNHYKKPVSPILRPFMKTKPIINSIASVLLLGKSTEINTSTRKNSPYPVNYNKFPMKVPYSDLQPLINSKKVEQPILKEKKSVSKDPTHPTKPQHKNVYKTHYEKIDEDEYRRKEAINTGFHPESVKVESGFIPILKKQDTDDVYDEEDDESFLDGNRRNDKNIEDEIEDKTLYMNHHASPDKKDFEPMFFPSPPDGITKKKEHLTGDLIDMDVEDGEDKMAVAAERQDIYYLPPRQEDKTPARTVVTYDGKAVLDTSLINSESTKFNPNLYNVGLKTEQLVRDTPQYGPFHGEVPPLTPDFVQSDSQNINSEQINKRPAPIVTEYLNPLSNTKNVGKPISTKLTLLRHKREPHHHPDHHGDEFDHSSSALIFSHHNFQFCFVSYILSLILI